MPDPKAPIDPSAVFISEDGEVKVFPQYARRSWVVALDRLTSAEERRQAVVPESLAVHTTRYHALSEAVVDARGRIAVLRLLAEREERDDLLDQAYAALEDILDHGFRLSVCKRETFDTISVLEGRDWRRKKECG